MNTWLFVAFETANVIAVPTALPVTICILFVRQFIVTVCEPEAGAYVAPTVSVHWRVILPADDGVPVNAGDARFAFRFNAVCCAVDTGFAVSAVLSTLHRPTSPFTRTRSVFNVATGTSSATHVAAEVRHLYVFVAILASFALVTTESSIVYTAPDDDTIISHLSQSLTAGPGTPCIP